MKERELYHYGRRGMHWGEWNEDTKARYLSQNIKGGKDKPNQSALERFTKINKDIIDNAKDISKVSVDNSNRSKIEKSKRTAKSMSDDELRKAINRLNMEKQYSQLVSEDIRSGSDTVYNMLSVFGDIAAIGASVATIASLAYGVKHGK